MKPSVLIAAAAAWSIAQPPPGAVTFAEVLLRAHQYVVIYEDHELSTVIAEEEYQQTVLNARGARTAQRTLRSDYLIFQLPPDEDWFALRDVYEVDGTKVGERLARVRQLFSTSGDSVQRAMAMAEESARFNLGNVVRTINVPTFPLRFLRPASRSRFRFEAAGEEEVNGVRAWIVSYQETGRPTFSVSPKGRDVPAHGRFWIEPQSGTIMQSELIMGGTRRVPPRASITVTYRRVEALGLWVPDQMLERYDFPRAASTSETVTATARYSSVRRFDRKELATPGPQH